MNNKKKLAEMLRRKKVLETKLTALREGRAFRDSLAYLIENALEKSEVVIAAQAITGKLSKMAEDLAKITGDDVMPLMDSLKEAFGPEAAESFQRVVTEKVNGMTQAMTQAKDAISAEVSKLEGIVNGQPGSDMASFDDAAPAPDALGDDPLAGSPDPLAADGQPEVPSIEPPADDEGDDLDDMFGDDTLDTNAQGRARKESYAPKGRPMKEGRATRRARFLNEGILDSVKTFIRPHAAKVALTGSPRERLESLKPFITAEDYEFLAQCPDPLLALVFDETTAPPAPVGGSASIGTTPPPAPAAIGVAPVVGHSLPSAGLGDDLDGDLDPMDDLDGLGDDLGTDVSFDMVDDFGDEDDLLPPVGAFESVATKRLRESRDPDALLVRAFRIGLREGASPVRAARAVAKAFGIDFSDVVEVVKEAAPVAPVKPVAPGQAAPATPAAAVPGKPATGPGGIKPAAPAKPANPADQSKARTLATKIKAQNPGGIPDEAIAQGVDKNITSVGKTKRDEPEMTGLVRDELANMGAVKEETSKAATTGFGSSRPMPRPAGVTMHSKQVAEGTKDVKWQKRAKLLKPKPVTMPAKKK